MVKNKKILLLSIILCLTVCGVVFFLFLDKEKIWEKVSFESLGGSSFDMQSWKEIHTTLGGSYKYPPIFSPIVHRTGRVDENIVGFQNEEGLGGGITPYVLDKGKIEDYFVKEEPGESVRNFSYTYKTEINGYKIKILEQEFNNTEKFFRITNFIYIPGDKYVLELSIFCDKNNPDLKDFCGNLRAYNAAVLSSFSFEKEEIK